MKITKYFQPTDVILKALATTAFLLGAIKIDL